MRKTLGAGVALVIVAVALSFLIHAKKPTLAVVAPEAQFSNDGQTEVSHRNTATSSASVTTTSATPTAPQTPTPPANLTATQGEVVPNAAPVVPLPPETVLENVRRMVHDYGEMFGGNPVGTNPEITSQLSGDNPKHIDFIGAQGGMKINGDGDLVDAWGTPYFFHQISGTEMEIHSAGPDKIMWTSDDLVAK